MRNWIKFAAILVAAHAAAQAVTLANPPSSPNDDRGVQVLTAKVVRYNRAVMTATYEGDLIVRIDGSGKFAHLIYSPYDFGFEDPPADLSQLLPQSMTADGSLMWTFTVHAPRDFREQGACTAVRAETKDRDGKPTPLDNQAYLSVPGAEGILAAPRLPARRAQLR
jgi:hypothetical protein